MRFFQDCHYFIVRQAPTGVENEKWRRRIAINYLAFFRYFRCITWRCWRWFRRYDDVKRIDRRRTVWFFFFFLSVLYCPLLTKLMARKWLGKAKKVGMGCTSSRYVETVKYSSRRRPSAGRPTSHNQRLDFFLFDFFFYCFCFYWLTIRWFHCLFFLFLAKENRSRGGKKWNKIRLRIWLWDCGRVILGLSFYNDPIKENCGKLKLIPSD